MRIQNDIWITLALGLIFTRDPLLAKDHARQLPETGNPASRYTHSVLPGNIIPESGQVEDSEYPLFAHATAAYGSYLLRLEKEDGGSSSASVPYQNTSFSLFLARQAPYQVLFERNNEGASISLYYRIPVDQGYVQFRVRSEMVTIPLN